MATPKTAHHPSDVLPNALGSNWVLNAQANGATVTLTMTTTVSPDEARRADLLTLSKEQYIKKYFKALGLSSAGMAECAREFGVNTPNITKWTAAGYIHRVGSDETHTQKVRVLRADVAFCADAMRLLGTRQRQKLFNPDGSIYIPKK
jgi:hypothetical protein